MGAHQNFFLKRKVVPSKYFYFIYLLAVLLKKSFLRSSLENVPREYNWK